jgi:hypothetical protein
MTYGIMSIAGQMEMSKGLARKMALQFYSKKVG